MVWVEVGEDQQVIGVRVFVSGKLGIDEPG